MSFADAHPGYRLQSEEEARNWLLELVAGVESARVACDVQTGARQQQKAYSTWLTRHGAALGTLVALHRCGMIGDVAYNELRAKVMSTMAPTVTVI